MNSFGLLNFFFFAIFGCVVMSCAEGKLTDAEKKILVKNMYRDYKEDFSEVRDVSPEVLKSWIDAKQDVVIVDVRKKVERDVSTLPSAISLEAYKLKAANFKNMKIVFYCTIGYRSGSFVNEKNQKNYYNLEGSILSWALSSYPLVKDGKPIKKIHVYGKKWNLVPSGYEAIW